MSFESGVEDTVFIDNCDWDPTYLYELFKEDFFDFGDMSLSDGVSDMELVNVVEQVEVEKYCPEVEDISLDDATLSFEVSKIEEE